MEGNLDGFAGRQEHGAHQGRATGIVFELTVQGTKASLKVNGQPAWEVDGLQSPAASSPCKSEVPGGGQFLFRNIRITELAARKTARPESLWRCRTAATFEAGMAPFV